MKSCRREPNPHPARHARHARRSPLACRLVAVALASCTILPAAATAQLAVTGVDPAGAFPGEPVVLTGTGFGQSPDALFCWVDTGDGGFPFEVTAATDRRIDATVGEVPVAATGTVKVWKGKRVPLADRVVLSQGRLFSATDGTVFVSSSAAVGPIFSAFGGSPGTFGSVTVNGTQRELRLDLGLLDLGDHQQRVRVTAVIETGSDAGNGTPNGYLVQPPALPAPGDPPPPTASPRGASSTKVAGNPADPAWAAAMTVETDASPASVEALAAGLAQVLQAQLGSAGLTARAEGTVVVVGHTLGIRAGFLDLTSK